MILERKVGGKRPQLRVVRVVIAPFLLAVIIVLYVSSGRSHRIAGASACRVRLLSLFLPAASDVAFFWPWHSPFRCLFFSLSTY